MRTNRHSGWLDEAIDELMQLVDRLPFVSGLARDVRSIRGLLYERRAPRIAVIGRAGSGKSSLLNELLAKPALPVDEAAPWEPGAWVRVHAAGSRVDWLEITLDDVGAPRGNALERAVYEMAPDCVLVVVRPSDLEHGIDDVLSRADATVRMLTGEHDKRPVVLGVLARHGSDSNGASGDDRVDTQIALDLERQRFERALRGGTLKVDEVVAVALETSRHGRGRVGPGLERLSEAICERLPERARIEGARALVHAPRSRREVARAVVHSCAALAATVAVTPIPLSDIWILGPLQVVMVSALAHLGGSSWDRKAIREWLASMGIVGGAGFGFRWTAQQLSKLVPGAGSLVSASVAGAGTAALGQSAMAYFLDGRAQPTAKGRRRRVS